jgi:hypothetical protein
MRTQNPAFGANLFIVGDVFRTENIKKGIRRAAKKLNCNNTKGPCNMFADASNVYVQNNCIINTKKPNLARPYKQMPLGEFIKKDAGEVENFIVDGHNDLHNGR